MRERGGGLATAVNNLIYFAPAKGSSGTMTEADITRLLDEYRASVKEMFAKGSSDLADNSSGRHAAILIEEMILHAERSFVAFSGTMNPEVWNGQVMAALEDAVNRGVDVKLVVEKTCEPISRNTMPASLRAHVRKLGPNVPENVRAILSHCASGDAKSMRVETDPVRKTAIFSANRPEMSENVTSIVDGLYSMSSRYSDVA